MLRKFFLFSLALSVLFGGLSATAQQNRNLTRDESGQKRLALIIGNGNYTNARKLVNPPNDANDMAATLQELGFEVISGTNLNLKQMTEKVREFGDKLKTSGGVGLFYYAGHGIQVNGRNYLIPVEADIPREDEISFRAFDLREILQKMETAKNGLNILVLDACRNNPFARSWSRDMSDDGLAQIPTPKGTFIAYATSPDMTASDGTGRNGLYTTELLKYIKQPNLKIEETFKEVSKAVDDKSGGKQTPWTSSSLRGDFIFKPSEKTAAVTKPSLTENPASISSPALSEKAKQTDVAITNSPSPFNFTLSGELEVLFKKEQPALFNVQRAIVSGNLSEIKDKRKVYVSAYWGDSTFTVKSINYTDSLAKKKIIEKLTKYGGVEIVETPETADFIIHYNGTTTNNAGFSEETDGYIIVVVCESAAAGGSDKARVLWKDKESKTKDFSLGGRLFNSLERHPADNMTRHFIDALKKVRGEK